MHTTRFCFALRLLFSSLAFFPAPSFRRREEQPLERRARRSPVFNLTPAMVFNPSALLKNLARALFRRRNRIRDCPGPASSRRLRASTFLRHPPFHPLPKQSNGVALPPCRSTGPTTSHVSYLPAPATSIRASSLRHPHLPPPPTPQPRCSPLAPRSEQLHPTSITVSPRLPLVLLRAHLGRFRSFVLAEEFREMQGRSSTRSI